MSEEMERLVPAEGVGRFLDEHLGASGERLEISRLGEGHSNLTFLVRRGSEEWVLRRPPRGHIQAGTHEMDREFRVMRAIAENGMAVPVPRPVALCESDEYIGSPFYLMEYVEGLVVRGKVPEVLGSPEHHRRMGEELADRLADIHSLDWQGIGLQGMARKPEEFLQRNLTRMQQLYDGVRHREVTEIDQVGDWLRAKAPVQRDVCLTHGDYKMDNVMWGPQAPPQIVAVVDWEISTVGDPMVDLGWLLYFSPGAGDEAALTGGPSGEGFLTRAELAARYAERTGRGLDELRFYCAFAGWKIAIIMEGSNYRFKQGMADDSMFSVLDAAVPALAQRSLDIISGDAPVGV